MASKLEMTLLGLVLVGIIVSAGSVYYLSVLNGQLTGTLADVTSKLDEVTSKLADTTNRLAGIEAIVGANVTPTTPGVAKDDLIIAFLADSPHLDPGNVKAGDRIGCAITITTCYEAYTVYKTERDPVTGALITTVTSKGEPEYLPGIAESWEHSADYKVWTIHIRNGAKFHSGNPVDAYACYQSIVQYTLNESAAYGWGWGFSPMFNFKHIAESIEVVDNSTLRFNLDLPNTNFLSFIGGSCALLVDWKWIEEHGDNTTIPFATPNGPLMAAEAGSGPYKLVYWERGKELVLERFEDYWGPKPKVKRLVFKIVTEIETAMMMLEKGQIDMIFPIGADHVAYLKTKPNIKVLSYQADNTVVLFNLNITPFDNIKVRQALQYTFPQKLFIQTVLYNLGVPSRSPLNPGFLTYTDEYWDPDERFNLTKAKQLLTEAGYPNGFETDIILGQGAIANQEDFAVIWQEQLAKIDVKLNIKVYPLTEWTQLVVKSKLAPIYLRGGNVPSVQDPLYQMFWPYHPNGSNYAHFNDTDWVTAFDNAMSESNTTKFAEYSKEMQRILIERGYIIPLFVKYQNVAMNSNTKDYLAHWNPEFWPYDYASGLSSYVEVPATE